VQIAVREFEGGTAPLPELHDPRLYINRELSSLAFNERVLEEACDPSVPPLERLKFLGIFSSNLDEFFMIRVAGIKQQLAGKVEECAADALTPGEVLRQISQRAHALVARQYAALSGDLLRALERGGLKLLRPQVLTPGLRERAAAYFEREVLPVLTPLAIDPGHPFPHLANKSLNVVVRFAPPARLQFGVVPVPQVLPRLVDLAEGGFLLLEELIALNVAQLFPGMTVAGCHACRVTRNWDLDIDEEEAEDLLVTIEREVRRRDRGNAVRLEIAASADEGVVDELRGELGLEMDDVYRIDGPLDVPALLPAANRLEAKELHEEAFIPAQLGLLEGADLFASLRERDVLLHHPYDSFDAVVAFIEAAADDPDVLAIKQTLYRTGRDSPFVRALQRAAENGKQVTALVELKARMDEEANIVWARALEQSGVHVVYGLLGIKTHCKIAMVVRREKGALRRYLHLGTGNYNTHTARAYADLSFFTSREEFAADAARLFNLLTSSSRPRGWSRFIVSPLRMRTALIELIEREARHASQGQPARIAAKMNALVDPEVIRALYRASQAGVQIDLLVRGICCLRPGLPGVSERIRVISIVDRFLEHERCFYFEAGGRQEVWLSSADWMPRNFQRRVEIAFPVEDPRLKTRIIEEVLQISLADDVKARRLRPDGAWERVPTQVGLRSQERLLAAARKAAAVDEREVRLLEPFLAGTAPARKRRVRRR
jgi:polyphosphate kinase